MKQKKKLNPVDTIVESIDVFVESSYEDSDISPEELALAKRRFYSALQYIIITTMEEFNEKKQVQLNPSSQHNA